MKVWAWRGSKHSSTVSVSPEEPGYIYARHGNDYYYASESIVVCQKWWRKLTGSGGTIKPSQYNLLGWRHR